MSVEDWDARLHLLLEEFWATNDGQISGYQGVFGDGTKFTIKFPKKKPKPAGLSNTEGTATAPSRKD